jgi:chromosome segregation protein
MLAEKHRIQGEKRATTRAMLTRINEQIAELNLEEKSLRLKLADAQAALEKLHEKTMHYSQENDKVMAHIIEANGLVRTAKLELVNREKLCEKARGNLENFQKELEKNRQNLTEESDTITELRIQISRRTEWVLQAEKTMERLQKEIDTLAQEKRLILSEISANDLAGKKAEADRLQKTEVLVKMQTRLEESREELTQGEAEKVELDSAISLAEAEERTHIDTTALLEREIARLEARKENLDAQSHRLHNEIWEEYNITHQNAQSFKRTDLSETALRRAGQQLRQELSQMTNVNIGAIEMYKQIKTKHGFLTAQRDDILGAEAVLDELILNLTTQMETQFAERFEVIAGHFTDVFREMFHGGKASLRLLDTNNVLESGIEIIAQPPGKSLQNLMLLSGGERALTAIALLFAILRMKPSPFCVLDEIESALDDANVTRFANFLKQYAKGTQFLIITHRKGTMEAADNMYGVTMEEQGISKLVTVKFVD